MFDYLVLHVFIHVIIYYALSRTNNYATSLIEIKMRKKKKKMESPLKSSTCQGGVPKEPSWVF